VAADTQWATAFAFGVQANEVTAQGFQIFRAFAQRNHPQWELAEAIEQVTPKAAVFDAFLQGLMGSRHQPEVGVLFIPGAQGAELAAFQYPQQFGLQGHGHVTDFIQEQGAAIGLGQQTFFGLVGAGEGAFGVAEQFALQQGVRDGGAVDHHQRTIRPVGHVVDAPGDHVFAAAGFALDQHRQLATGGTHHLGPEVHHGFGVADQGMGQLFTALAQGFGVVQVVQGAFEHAPLPDLVAGLQLADPLMHQQLFDAGVQGLADDALPVWMVAAEHKDAQGAAVFASEGFKP